MARLPRPKSHGVLLVIGLVRCGCAGPAHVDDDEDGAPSASRPRAPVTGGHAEPSAPWEAREAAASGELGAPTGSDPPGQGGGPCGRLGGASDTDSGTPGGAVEDRGETGAVGHGGTSSAASGVGPAAPGGAAPTWVCGVTPTPRLLCFDPTSGTPTATVALDTRPTSLAWHAASSRLLATFSERTDTEGTRVVAFAGAPLAVVGASEILPGRAVVVTAGLAALAIRVDEEAAFAVLDSALGVGPWEPIAGPRAEGATSWVPWAPGGAVLLAAQATTAARWTTGDLPPPPPEVGPPLVVAGAP